MKKILSLVLATTMLLSLTACGCEHEFDAGTITKEATCSEEGTKTYKCALCGDEKTESIPCVPHEYEEKVDKEPTFDSTGIATYTCKICGDSYSEDIPKKERTVNVTVTDKRNVPEDIYNGRFSDRVEFTFTLENQSDKPVKGVEGVLHIQDLFDKDILSMNCDFTGQTIPANESITISDLGMDINPFMDDHSKLYNEDFSDLKFVYEITNIVYDGDTIATETNQDEDVPVNVNVVDKKNIPEDIYNGQFSPRVQFVIEVSNNSDKEIKGVSGVLTIKDLFGKDILSSTCDFTGQPIAVGSTVTFSDLGMDINEFMDDHTKLYNENYSDLIFEYKVESVVYSNGETESFN